MLPLMVNEREVGWHPDPEGPPGSERYWDGQTWTAYSDDPPDLYSDDWTPPPVPKPAARPAPQPRQRSSMNVNTAVRIIGIIVGIAVLAVFGWNRYTDSQDSKELAELSDQVQTSIQDNLNSDTQYAGYGIRVVSVDLVKVTDSKYEGKALIATTASPEGNLADVEITLFANGRMSWEIPPGELLFLLSEPSAAPSAPSNPGTGWG